MECSDNAPFLNFRDNICTEICYFKDFLNKKCTLNINNIKTKELFISNIRNEIKDDSMNKLLLEVINEKKDLSIKENNTLYQITSSFNQNYKNYQNISTIKLEKFENLIKDRYNISQNETLIIFKIEEYINTSLIPLIEYEIFHPITKEKLNLNFDNNDLNISSFIYIYIPVTINEKEIYKYNLNSSYYNNICNISEKEGIDLTLFDRKNQFIQKNLFLCPNNCIYIDYDFNYKKSICKCQIQGDILQLKNNENTTNKIINEKKLLNLNIMSCYKLLFSKNGLIKNIGNYIIFIITVIYIILTIYFYLKGYNLLSNKINELFNIKYQILSNESYSNKDLKNEVPIKDNISGQIPSTKNIKIRNKRNIIYRNNYQIKKNLDINSSKNIEISNNELKNIDEKSNQKYFINYIESEINNISYEEALDNDKRTFFQYYITLLKEKHIILFTFYSTKDYNSFIIKICLLLFSLALFFIINAFFFNDLMMHKIYEDKGEFNLIYILPQTFYSVIICTFIIIILKKLCLSQKNILELKYESNIYNLQAKTIIVIKRLIIKFFIFFIITIFFLLFFWYYLSCFCLIYKNSQLYLIKATIISYIISIIYPFIICLLLTIIRILSLKNLGKHLYEISKIMQLI